MKIIHITACLFFFLLNCSIAQTITAYTTAQAHSHNDYEQKRPFSEAYKQQFGSIEADLFLVDSILYTAHNYKDITPERTFKKLYLDPILFQIEKNKGNIYPQQNLTLQLLIDLKTPAEETLEALITALKPMEQFLEPKGPVKIVVSGNVPAPENFERYPAFIFFDGRPEISYSPDQLKRIGLISQSFQKYSKWNGEGDLPAKDKKAILKVIETTHQLGKKVRFWAIPDNIQTWKTMMGLNVDFVNTDKVVQLGDYLRTAPR